MAAHTELTDELWDFGNASGAVPLDSTSGSSSDEEYEKPAPLHKRRRKSATVKVPDLVVLEESSAESDSDLDIVQNLEKRRAKKKAAIVDDLDSLIHPSTKQQSKKLDPQQMTNPVDAAAALRMRHSLQQLQALKSQLDTAAMPENEGKEDSDEDADKENQTEEAAAPEKIVVKIRWSNRDDPVKLRIATNVPFERLFGSFTNVGIKRGLFDRHAELKFNFDGEVIQPSDTAQQLDIEDDCVIEVSW